MRHSKLKNVFEMKMNHVQSIIRLIGGAGARVVWKTKMRRRHFPFISMHFKRYLIAFSAEWAMAASGRGSGSEWRADATASI